jgi:alginate O-acetyltransferase complex protein AlgI
MASLFFYAWGEAELVLVMVASIVFNYLIGLAIGHYISNNKISKLLLSLGVVINLSILVYFKYINFLLDNLNLLFKENIVQLDHIVLPIGISFFTFQSLSYLVDVYRKTVPPQNKIISIGLYISLFPQLIAGPIVRYEDIYKDIKERTMNNSLFLKGIKKFIRGLSKKIIIANAVGFISDQVFMIPATDLGSPLAWIGLISYAFQIYFDFSGYSDMAIGLGMMFGFNFKENFNYPYISKSIKEFWRRWHISLSTWFRDYLYIPLGGNRISKHRTYLNLLIVFFVTGLWHGASWNFVIWGFYHGFFIILEKKLKFKLPNKLSFLRNIYLVITVLIGWVFFRAENLSYSIDFIITLFDFSKGTNNLPLTYITNYTIFIFILGIIFSTPIRPILLKYVTRHINISFVAIIEYFIYFFLLLYCVLELAHSSYNPFIYFRF